MEVILKSKNWLPTGVRILDTEIAGAGNMNLVERIFLDNGQSLILKRSRGWVEKYPDIPAPIERASVEAAFYQCLSGTPAGDAMPQHLGYYEEDAANLFEDLGPDCDGTFVYEGKAFPTQHVDSIADWATHLHAIPITQGMRQQFDNKAMRELNGLHIFDFPLDPNNGFSLDDITPGLQALGDVLKQDETFVSVVKGIGARYVASSVAENDVLLHGDLYPGSCLITNDRLFVIDPEFAWIGPPEWDIGVLMAHMYLSQQSMPSIRDRLLASYKRPLDEVLLNQIAGIEIMRRLIGVAQLPLQMGLADKKALLDLSYELVTGSSA